jgi:hypothetical protein
LWTLEPHFFHSSYEPSGDESAFLHRQTDAKKTTTNCIQ